MPDEPRPQNSSAGDARDERLAEVLAVAPLDELTRRRLVATAIDSGHDLDDDRSDDAGRVLAADSRADNGGARSIRRMRQLVAAAALVFVAVAGAGVFVAVQGSGSPDQVAAQGRRAERAAGLDLGASAPPIGNFGELTINANVERLVAASASLGVPLAGAASPQAANGKASESTAADAASSAVPDTQLACSPRLGGGTTIATASGTYHGKDALVVVRAAADGTHSYYAVDVDTCTVHRLS